MFSYSVVVVVVVVAKIEIFSAPDVSSVHDAVVNVFAFGVVVVIIVVVVVVVVVVDFYDQLFLFEMQLINFSSGARSQQSPDYNRGKT